MAKTVNLLLGKLAGAMLTAAAFAVSPTAWAQDAAKLAPQMYRVIFENEHYRVIDYHLKAGEKEPMHSHPNGVLVYWFTDANTRNTFPDGRTDEFLPTTG